ncbi:hypothetical protein [Kamptonema sp. PCC 6506]|uniref:hypothetical protein n=2 Tax=Kamptonema TaxID=1501433 RepID=UPI0011D24838|nr:hypothetical protein [Kamptonema sp. PCC 6506]
MSRAAPGMLPSQLAIAIVGFLPCFWYWRSIPPVGWLRQLACNRMRFLQLEGAIASEPYFSAGCQAEGTRAEGRKT